MNVDKNLVDSIVSKTMDGHTQLPGVSYLMSFEDLYKLLTDEEIAYVKELLKLDPSEYGVKEPFRGLDDVPSDVVAIENQVVHYDGKDVEVETMFLPRSVFEAYTKLRQAYKTESGRSLFVGSGYRSPARQAVNFFKWLRYYKYDLQKTLGFVSVPGYSDHGLAKNTAIDFMNQDGIECFDTPPFGNFEETEEYVWLQKNAEKYDFVLTCTKDNDQGFNFEPWHWQFQG